MTDKCIHGIMPITCSICKPNAMKERLENIKNLQKEIKNVKGGMSMQKFRTDLEEVIGDLRRGKLPTKTAHEIHLTAHRIVMHMYAEAKLTEILGQEITKKREKELRKSILDKTTQKQEETT